MPQKICRLIHRNMSSTHLRSNATHPVCHIAGHSSSQVLREANSACAHVCALLLTLISTDALRLSIKCVRHTPLRAHQRNTLPKPACPASHSPLTELAAASATTNTHQPYVTP